MSETIIHAITGKQRNGPTGETTLAYIKQFMRFENYAVRDRFDIGDRSDVHPGDCATRVVANDAVEVGKVFAKIVRL